jgi:hypothetical protein
MKNYFSKQTGKFRQLEIGDLVKWTVSNKTRRGIFKQEINNTAEVNSTFIENQIINLKCFVPLDLIELDE